MMKSSAIKRSLRLWNLQSNADCRRYAYLLGKRRKCRVVSVKTGGFEERNRPYVVDHSGSMIDMDTLEFAKEALSDLVGCVA